MPPYRFRLDFSLAKGKTLRAQPLDTSHFAPAIERVFFEAFKKGKFCEYQLALENARLVPHFAHENSPEVKDFTVSLTTLDGKEETHQFDASFFEERACDVARELIHAGQVPQGGTVLYRLTAIPEELPENRPQRRRITLGAPSIEVPIREVTRQSFGLTEPWDKTIDDPFTVLLARHVIDDALEEARAQPQREVGGALLGHLCRDPGTREVFLVVTALVPGEETEATATSVTFTPATWARVRQVMAHRGEGEIFVGWAHSHPFRLCAECPQIPPPECVRKVLFYSEDDEFLMRLSFSQPFMVGLLAAVEPKLEAALGHAPIRLFGWHNGKIEPRGFDLYDM